MTRWYVLMVMVAMFVALNSCRTDRSPVSQRVSKNLSVKEGDLAHIYDTLQVIVDCAQNFAPASAKTSSSRDDFITSLDQHCDASDVQSIQGYWECIRDRLPCPVPNAG